MPTTHFDESLLLGYTATLAKAKRARHAPGTTQTLVCVRLTMTPRDEIADHALAGTTMGVQDVDGSLAPGSEIGAGKLGWNIAAVLAHDPSRDSARWIGTYVHGRPGEEFLYVSWKDHPAATHWRLRIKAQLHYARPLLNDIRARPRPVLSADLTDRRPHDSRPVEWRLST